jgi:hypothetical protein
MRYSSSPQEHDIMSDAVQEDGSVMEEIYSAQPEHIPYSDSGVVEKRKRMQRLVAQRAHKRLRR